MRSNDHGDMSLGKKKAKFAQKDGSHHQIANVGQLHDKNVGHFCGIGGASTFLPEGLMPGPSMDLIVDFIRERPGDAFARFHAATSDRMK
jgi:hypothetical protein